MEAYQPFRILLTGGAGFIMSHVTDQLLQDFPECFIVVLDVMDYCSSDKNLQEALATGRCKLVRGDVRNMELLTYVLESERIDTVIHGCAVSHVDLSFGDSLVFTDVNTKGSHILLESIRRYNSTSKEESRVKRIIMVSTDEVYGSQSEQTHESSPFDVTNPYSASKAAMECFCQAYSKSYKLPIIITRGNNVMGERQYPEKLIPKFIELTRRGAPLTIHGGGQQQRSYMYVKDVASAFTTIIKYGKIHEKYNIEAGCELTVTEVAHRILAEFKIPEEEWADRIRYVEDRPFNDQRYFINGDKLRELGWQPVYEFEGALKDTVRWYIDHPDWWANTESALVAHPKLTQYVRG